MKKKNAVFTVTVAALIAAAAAAIIVALISAPRHSEAARREYCGTVELTSPDGARVLVIREWRLGDETGAYMLLRGSDDKSADKTVGSAHPEGGATPFSDGNYTVTWTAGSVTVRYRSGKAGETDSPDTWAKVTYEFKEDAGTEALTDENGYALR